MIRWSPRAFADLVALGDFIARDNPEAARTWVDKLRNRFETAAESPLAGRKVPEFRLDEVREVFVRTYRLVYRVDSEGITVLTIIEGHRTLTAIEGAPDTRASAKPKARRKGR